MHKYPLENIFDNFDTIFSAVNIQIVLIADFWEYQFDTTNVNIMQESM